MSRLEKEIDRLKSKPKDYTYDELKSLLNKIGFLEYNKGKTSGSKVSFINQTNIKIELHKPHPNNVLKPYQIIEILRVLEKGRLI